MASIFNEPINKTHGIQIMPLNTLIAKNVNSEKATGAPAKITYNDEGECFVAGEHLYDVLDYAKSFSFASDIKFKRYDGDAATITVDSDCKNFMDSLGINFGDKRYLFKEIYTTKEVQTTGEVIDGVIDDKEYNSNSPVVLVSTNVEETSCLIPIYSKYLQLYLNKCIDISRLGSSDFFKNFSFTIDNHILCDAYLPSSSLFNYRSGYNQTTLQYIKKTKDYYYCILPSRRHFVKLNDPQYNVTIEKISINTSTNKNYYPGFMLGYTFKTNDKNTYVAKNDDNFKYYYNDQNFVIHDKNYKQKASSTDTTGKTIIDSPLNDIENTNFYMNLYGDDDHELIANFLRCKKDYNESSDFITNFKKICDKKGAVFSITIPPSIIKIPCTFGDMAIKDEYKQTTYPFTDGSTITKDNIIDQFYSVNELLYAEKDRFNPSGVSTNSMNYFHYLVDNVKYVEGPKNVNTSEESYSAYLSEAFKAFGESYNYYNYDYDEFIIKSLKTIIGMPVKMMNHVDGKINNNGYGKHYSDNILMDMPIVILKPGGAVAGQYEDAADFEGETNIGEVAVEKVFSIVENLKDIFTDFGTWSRATFMNSVIGRCERLYTWASDIDHYIEYVNTLCHLFIAYLGIDNMDYITNSGTPIKYRNYDDTFDLSDTVSTNVLATYKDVIETKPSTEAQSIYNIFGVDPAIYAYCKIDERNDDFENSTQESTIAGAAKGATDMSKEIHFLAGAQLPPILKGMANNVSTGLSNISNAIPGGGVIGNLFGNIAEGASVLIGGHEFDFPKIWNSSSTSANTAQFEIKLESPYGDPESIFLYVLRPLARLMALTLPKQHGYNSYGSPFTVQAFSKGMFNIQLGIVRSMSIVRDKSTLTVNNIPRSLIVNMTIEDLYTAISLSNEYGNGLFAGPMAAKLLFNNIGLVDFAASYCGYNLNQPSTDIQWTLFTSIFANRFRDLKSYTEEENGKKRFFSPAWERLKMDMYAKHVKKYTQM